MMLSVGKKTGLHLGNSKDSALVNLKFVYGLRTRVTRRLSGHTIGDLRNVMHTHAAHAMHVVHTITVTLPDDEAAGEIARL